jgi:hypothetical protein
METPISKTQKRAMSLLNLTPVSGYQAAAEALETAGYRPDGIPQGMTWRTAAKLSDAELIASITIALCDDFDDYKDELRMRQ